MTGTSRQAHVEDRLASALRQKRDAGGKLLVPYVTAGMVEGWTDVVHAAAEAGADAVEIGIPFSDPMIDGPVIQRASTAALARGTTPAGVLGELARLDAGAPLLVMTYYNLLFHMGLRRAAGMLADAGVCGVIVPDLPLDEMGEWAVEADRTGIATVLLAAPTTEGARMAAICARSRGFVYGVGLLGVTGERAELAASAEQVARRLKALTDLPVLIGIGISTPAQAAAVTAVADGVVVGSALVRRLLDGAGTSGAAQLVGAFRAGLDRREEACASGTG